MVAAETSSVSKLLGAGTEVAELRARGRAAAALLAHGERGQTWGVTQRGLASAAVPLLCCVPLLNRQW